MVAARSSRYGAIEAAQNKQSSEKKKDYFSLDGGMTHRTSDLFLPKHNAKSTEPMRMVLGCVTSTRGVTFFLVSGFSEISSPRPLAGEDGARRSGHDQAADEGEDGGCGLQADTRVRERHGGRDTPHAPPEAERTASQSDERPPPRGVSDLGEMSMRADSSAAMTAC